MFGNCKHTPNWIKHIFLQCHMVNTGYSDQTAGTWEAMPLLIRVQWWKDEASRCFFPIGISAWPVFWVAFSALKLLVECEWQEGHSAHQNSCATYLKGSLLEQVGMKTEGKLTDHGSSKKAVNMEVMVWWSSHGQCDMISIFMNTCAPNICLTDWLWFYIPLNTK